MLVSVCLIVRNEENNLTSALNSIPSNYEVIVVDTGSTDKTVEIALSLGAKVSYYIWNNNFSDARNESIAQAQGDYILILDADEQLCAGSEQKIQNFILQYPQTAGTVTIHNIIDDEINKHRMVRFFPNNPDFFFHGTVHESVVNKGKSVVFEDTNVEVIHTGYQHEQYNEKNKSQRYLNLYMEHLEAHPNDGYMLYQLGKLYYSIHDLQNAKEILVRCLQVGEENNLYFPAMLVIFGYTLKELGQSIEAETILSPYTTNYCSFPDLPFLLGLISMETGNIANIENYFLQALQIGETNKYSSVHGVGTFKAAYNLGVYYEVIGNKNKALKYYQQSADYGYNPAEERIRKINIQ
ncbi:MAG: glycosyltransferase [Bacilli bacterium]|nr:glycosyltransferase [Bacilli bacterium]